MCIRDRVHDFDSVDRMRDVILATLQRVQTTNDMVCLGKLAVDSTSMISTDIQLDELGKLLIGCLDYSQYEFFLYCLPNGDCLLYTSISQETANDVTTDVYTMTAPKQRETDSANAAAAGNKIFGLTAEKVIAFNVTDEQLEEYGLKDPYSKVTVDYADQTITLMSSEPDDEGMAYVMNASKNVIFQANVSELGWVTATYEDLVSKTVMAPMVNDCLLYTSIPVELTFFYLNCEINNEQQEIDKINNFLDSISKWKPEVLLVNDDQATYSLLETHHPLLKGCLLYTS